MLLLRFQRLNLWPRLVIAVTVGFLVLFGIFSLLSMRAVNDSTERIFEERFVIAQMAAREIDRLVERGFFELEKATEFAAFDPQVPFLSEETHMLAHAYGRVGALSLGVYFLDGKGKVVLSEPIGKLPVDTDLSGEAYINQVMAMRTRSVSEPFADATTGKPAVALTIPIFGPDGNLMSMLSGLIDVTSDEVMGPLIHARGLGHTGHSELVDNRGLIIASTDPGGFLKRGEHLPFYLRMFQEGGRKWKMCHISPGTRRKKLGRTKITSWPSLHYRVLPGGLLSGVQIKRPSLR
ncbi:MAG: cache domain-containing protein [Dehalococcoidia bacterium]